MINLKKIMFKLFIAVTFLISVSNVNAALMNFTITGDVIFGEEGGIQNAFALVAGDTISLTGVFDDNALLNGNGTISFGASSGNSLSISFGDSSPLILTEMSDENYGTQWTESFMTLTNNSLVDFSFFARPGTNGSEAYFSSFGLGFDDVDNLYGEWNTNVEMSAVPVPAALWLFGSGLIGLIGIAKRKNKA